MLVKSENCRICLEDHHSSGNVSLKDASPLQGKTFSDVYDYVSGCMPETGPQNLCKRCSRDLIEAYKLKEKIQDVERMFTESISVLDIKESMDDDEEMVDVKVEPFSIIDSDRDRDDSDDYFGGDPEPMVDSPEKPAKVRKKKTTTNKPSGGEKPKEKPEPFVPIFGYCICPYCPYTGPCQRNFRKHCRRTHSKKDIRCWTCTKSFTYSYQLEKHLVEECEITFNLDKPHDEENPSAISISCSQCPEVYNDYYYLALHSKTKHPDSNMSCQDCENSSLFYVTEHWAFHRKRTHFDKNVKMMDAPQEKSESICAHCGKMMTTGSLYYHMQTVHEKKSEQVEYICDICGAKIHRKNGVLQHMRHKHMGTVYNCRYCSEKFNNVGNRRNHEIRFHTSDYKHYCNICCKYFITNSQLRKHRVIHTGEKNFRCDICGMLFAWRGTWRNHMVTHTDARPFCCGTCGGTFKTRKALRNHENVHKEYNYECPVCQQKVIFCLSKCG